MNWRTFVLGLSIGLNIAFLGIWGFDFVEDTLHGNEWSQEQYERDQSRGSGDGDRFSARHFYDEKLDVTDTQWSRIEPRLTRYHRTAFDLCRRIGHKRNELIRTVARDSPADTEIEQVKQEILSMRRDKQRLTVDYFKDKKDHLSREQYRTLFDILQQKPHCSKHRKLLGEFDR